MATDEFIPSKSEEITNGAMLEWYEDEQIVAYTLKSADEGIFNAWSVKVAAIVKDWESSKPYLAMHDISAPGCAVFYMIYAEYHILNAGISPQGRTFVEDYINAMEHPAKVAIVVSPTLSGRVTRHSADLTANESSPPPIEYKTFFSRDAALEWLGETIN